MSSNKKRKTSDDVDEKIKSTFRSLELVLHTMKTTGAYDDDRTEEEKSHRRACWDRVLSVIVNNPEIVALSYDDKFFDDEEPLQLLHFGFFQSAPKHAFKAILEAFPQGLDYLLDATRCEETTLGQAILSYPGEFQLYSDRNVLDTNRIQMSRLVLEMVPKSFSKLDDRFRKTHRSEDSPAGGAVCGHIFGNLCGRLYLLDPMESTFGREKLRLWLKKVTLWMIHPNENFPIAALKYLVQLYKPDQLRITMATSQRNRDGNNTVTFEFWDNVFKVGESGGTAENILEIRTNPGRERSDSFHLNSLLRNIRSVGTLPPVVDVGCDETDLRCDFHDYWYRLHTGSDVKGLNYFAVDPDVARMCNGLEEFQAVLDVTQPKQLLDFAAGLERFPNLKSGGALLYLKISAEETNGDDASLWEQAFSTLGGVNSLGHVSLGFHSSQTPVPEEAIQRFLETTKVLETLEVQNYCKKSLDPFANGLKLNTSIQECTIYGSDEIVFDTAMFMETLKSHNYTLHYVQLGGVDVDVCNRYTAMNVAGRERLLGTNATKRDAVDVFLKTLENERDLYTGISNKTDTLYGLLRLRPDLWAK